MRSGTPPRSPQSKALADLMRDCKEARLGDSVLSAYLGGVWGPDQWSGGFIDVSLAYFGCLKRFWAAFVS